MALWAINLQRGSPAEGTHTHSTATVCTALPRTNTGEGQCNDFTCMHAYAGFGYPLADTPREVFVFTHIPRFRFSACPYISLTEHA